MEGASGRRKAMTCRKDMQCTCSMCLASFQATWDLRRPLGRNNAFRAVTNLAEAFSADEGSFETVARRSTPRTGKENNVATTTPVSGSGNDEKICRPAATPFLTPIRHHQRFTDEILDAVEENWSNSGSNPLPTPNSGWKGRWALAFCLLSAVLIFTLPKVLSAAFPPALSEQRVAEAVDESRGRGHLRLSDRLHFIRTRLSESVLDGRAVRNCSGPGADWGLSDCGCFVRSECRMLASVAETVTVWGSPVKTGGVLGRAGRRRSYVVVAGRVFEWRDGRPEYNVHAEGDRWVVPAWAKSVLFLEGNTWVIEYKEGIFAGVGSLRGMAGFLRNRLRMLVASVLSAFDSAALVFSIIARERSAEIPMPT